MWLGLPARELGALSLLQRRVRSRAFRSPCHGFRQCRYDANGVATTADIALSLIAATELAQLQA
jgi:hypothetical protein